jgi:hypothetical protein
MRNRGILATLFVVASTIAMGQGDFTLTGIVPEAGTKTALDVNYTGTFPADPSAYLDKDAWRVWVRKPNGTNPEELEVTAIEKIESPNFTINKLRLSLSGDLPAGNAVGTSAWHALFNPSKASGLEGFSFDSVVNTVIEISRARPESEDWEQVARIPTGEQIEELQFAGPRRLAVRTDAGCLLFEILAII